jgi:hypothetical protein
MRLLQVVATTLLLGLSARPALAQSQPAAQPQITKLTLSQPSTGGTKGHLTLRVTLTDGGGAPLNDRSISFYEQTNAFGQRDALLGTAVTDSSGYAAIDYQPAEAGSQLIKVRFLGDDQLAASDASSTIQVRDLVPPYSPEPLPLATVRAWLPLGLASLVLATWAVLIGVSLRTILGIRGATAARKQEAAVFAFTHEAHEGRDS